MQSNAPENYICPICLAVDGIENEDTWIVQDDIFYRDEDVMGFISSKSIKGNECHPLIVPTKHYENIYEMPDDVLAKVIQLSKKVALAVKETRNADGVTILQNNEPAGDQHAFHYHMHVVPRFNGDNFHEEVWRAERNTPEERRGFVEELKKAL